MLIFLAVGPQNSLRRVCRDSAATRPVGFTEVLAGGTTLELISVPGWLSSLSWLVGVASAMFIAGNLIPTLISMQDPSFVPKPWHGYLFVVAICVFCFLVNAWLSKYLPLVEGFVFCFTVLAFAAIVIVSRTY